MDLIADTNIFLAVALNEAAKDEIVRLTIDASISAPEILPYEVGNALSALLKRKKLTQSEALTVLKVVNRVPVRLVSADIQASLTIAAEYDIYAYDAYFLQCAMAYSYPLLTQDKRMRKVAKELGIQVLELD